MPNFVTFRDSTNFEVENMNDSKQSGFSLIELLLVVVIIGVIATITFPMLSSAKQSAENRNAYATLRSISSTQVSYFTANSRFGRLDELNSGQSNTLGTMSGTDLIRGKFVFTMTPVSPTNAELRDGYEIVATKAVIGSEIPYVVSLNQTGYIDDVFP
jgi:prepilin-type N-terminal cleavage/methylation domain-containing protein